MSMDIEPVLGTVLYVDPDPFQGQHIYQLLHSSGIDATWVKKHLHGLSLTDEQTFDLVLASAQGTDIDGCELCRLLRRRQEVRSSVPSGTMLLGQDHDVERFVSLGHALDDYLIHPFMDDELLWRVRRNVKNVQQLQDIRGGNTTGSRREVRHEQGMLAILEEELNRGARRSDHLGLVVIKIRGWDLLRMDVGQAGARMVENILADKLRSSVRSYDVLAHLEQGVFAVLLPDSSLSGVQGFIRRLEQRLTDLVRFETLAQGELDSISFIGFCLQTDALDPPSATTAHELWNAVTQEAGGEQTPDLVTCVRVGQSGVQITPQGDEKGTCAL